jgi:hypothetical protein
MVRKEKNGNFIENGIFSTKYQFSVGRKISKTKLSKAKYNSLLQLQSLDPVKIMTDQEKSRTWWMYEDVFYIESEGMSGDDVKVFALEKSGKKKK